METSKKSFPSWEDENTLLYEINFSSELKSNGVKGDEESINFRPSPNFKHMRKYCKPKLKENANENNSEGEQSPMINSEEQRDQVVPKTVMVQPPLPPNPPPPDITLRPLVLKKEIEDADYSTENEEPRSPVENLMGEFPKPEENQDSKKKTMCRDWARGNCKRGAAKCDLVHEIILSQLPTVYTFCKNFQNFRCFYPKCKFVHATVFEKEHYFRTGYLPPHTLAHLKENNVVQPAPPHMQETPTDLKPVVYNNPPPTMMQTSPSQTMAVAAANIGGCPPSVPPPAPHPVVGTNITDALTTALAVTSPQKREWTDIEDFNSSTALDTSEPVIKKCKNCVMNEFRLQCNKNKVIKMMRASEEMHKKTTLLTKKNDNLYKVLVSLLKTTSAGKENGTNILNTPAFNIRTEKEKSMMEQINMIFSADNRISLSTEEKNHMTSNISNISSSTNFSSVLVKLLLNNSEQSITSDSS